MTKISFICILIIAVFQNAIEGNAKPKMLLQKKTDLRYLNDSLLENKIDTVLYYYRSCASCMCGIRELTYVFWVKDGRYHLAFPGQIWYKKRVSKRIPEYTIIEGMMNNEKIFVWLQDLAMRANKEKINEGKFTILNYSFEELNLNIGQFKYRISLTDYEREANIDKFHTIIFDKYLSWYFGMIPLPKL